jgi:hypothetical protein
MNKLSQPTAAQILLAATFAAFAPSAQAQVGNLVRDGDFEMVRVPDGGATSFPGGSSGVPDWSIAGVEVSVVSTTHVYSGFTFAAHSGSQWMDLSGLSGPSPTNSISQFVTTEVGRQYELSFYVGSAWNTDWTGPNAALFYKPTIDVVVQGQPSQSFTNTNTAIGTMNWQGFSMTFTAISSSTEIGFRYGNTGPLNYVVGLDTVSVTVVPGPGALGVVLAGVGLGARCRRRRA